MNKRDLRRKQAMRVVFVVCQFCGVTDRSMSDEELSMVIMCPHQLDGKTDCTEPNCFRCALKWLKKPAEEDDHA
ncbi:MAG: hypothetical protein SOY13_05250 [Pseudoflavonifractor sp.]|nr:hypothetical protein [Pseudoflavonifractor sp.]